MGNFLCLLLGVLLAVFSLGLAIRRGVRPLAAASSYRNVAWRLSLDADTRGLSMQGFWDRRRIFVGEVFTPGSRPQRSPILAVLDLHAPLGVGLLVRRRHTNRLDRFRRVKVKRLEVGDPEIDEHLELRAFEPSRAKALFTDEVRDAVCTLQDSYPDLELTDHWVKVHLARHPSSDRQLLALVEAMRAVVTALETARAGLSPSPDVEPWLPHWAALATRRGLTLNTSLPALTGTLQGQDLTVHAVRGEEGFGIDLFVTFPDHAPLGLQMSPQRDGHDMWSSHGQDIEVGHRALDDAYVIKGYDPSAIRALLTPAARQALLELGQRAQVKLHDLGIDVHADQADPEVIEGLIDLCDTVLASLAW